MRNIISANMSWAVILIAGCSEDIRKNTVVTGAARMEQVKHEVFDKFGNYVETISKAKEAGCDYLDTVCKCLLHDEKAMHEIFVISPKGHFDAASSEGHSGVLSYILRDVGDRFFGYCLAGETESVQQEVREYILYDIGYGNTEIEEQDIRHDYPKTFPNSWKWPD